MLDMIKQYAAVFKEERKKDCTANPIVVVESKEAQVSKEGYHDDYAYVYEEADRMFYSPSELTSYLQEWEDWSTEDIEELAFNDKKALKKKGIKRFPVVFHYRPVAFFLTRKEAIAYTKYQGHNLGTTRVYSHYVGYGNHGDLEKVLPELVKLGHLLNEGRGKSLSWLIEHEKLTEEEAIASVRKHFAKKDLIEFAKNPVFSEKIKGQAASVI